MKNDEPIQLTEFETNVWDVVASKAIEIGETHDSAIATADWFIEQRRLRHRKLREEFEQRRREADERMDDSGGMTAYYPAHPVETMDAEGRGHLGIIKGGLDVDDEEPHGPIFLDCESEEGGMVDTLGTMQETYEALRDHRHAIPGEAEEILAWMKVAPVGAMMHYSKGIVTRVDPTSKIGSKLG